MKQKYYKQTLTYSETKMNKKLFLIFGIVFLFSLTLVNSLDEFGIVKQNECINVSQLCSSCSYVNISSISNQDNSNLITNIGMDYFGNGEWRYEFCNTTQLGRYDVKGQGDINGIDTSFATYFEVTSTGDNNNFSAFFLFGFILFYGLVIYGVRVQNPWIGLIGCFGILILGIYTLVNGIGNTINNLTLAFSWINIAIGLGLGFESAIEITYL